MRRYISCKEDLGRIQSVFDVDSPYRQNLQSFSQTMYKKCSPYLNDIHKKAYGIASHCKMCSTCACLYISNPIVPGKYFLDNPGKVVKHTKKGVYTIPQIPLEDSLNIKVFQKLQEKVKYTLLYGASLTHSEKDLDPEFHLENQVSLLQEAYGILYDNLCDDVGKLFHTEKEEVVLYLEISNPVENAINSDGNKITHPHVWIKTYMKKYGKAFMTIPMDQSDADSFIRKTTEIASGVYAKNGKKKVYVKYYIDENTYKIKRCEIDIE